MLDIIVRTSSEPMALASVIQQQIQAADKSVAKFKIARVSDELSEETGERRFDTFLIGSFAIAALLLSAMSISGLLHHVVAQRTNEIGVRVALGARPGEVMSMVLRQGLSLALIGAGIGLAGAILVSRLLAKMLFEVTPTDPLTLGVSVLLLIVVAAVACWAPSYRAARIDPILALRHD